MIKHDADDGTEADEDDDDDTGDDDDGPCICIKCVMLMMMTKNEDEWGWMRMNEDKDGARFGPKVLYFSRFSLSFFSSHSASVEPWGLQKRTPWM